MLLIPYSISMTKRWDTHAVAYTALKACIPQLAFMQCTLLESFLKVAPLEQEMFSGCYRPVC